VSINRKELDKEYYERLEAAKLRERELIESEVWIDRDGRELEVVDMSKPAIDKCINNLKHYSFGIYLVEDWIAMFEGELLERRYNSGV